MYNLSKRTEGFTDSVIRRMTRISLQYQAVNLSQGFPDFDPPKELLDRLAEVGDVSDVRYMIEHATDVPVSMDELVGETRRLLNSLPTPADRQAVTWALYRFIDKVIHVDGVVREPEREAFETWINSLLT